MTNTMNIGEDDRVYATEAIEIGIYGDIDVPAGTEGIACFRVEHEVVDWYVEFDNGVSGTVSSDSIALVPVTD